MYFITYVDRVNVSTAAIEFSKEFHLSNTQVGLVFSAFAYPYLLFQVIRRLGRRSLRPAPHADHLLDDLGGRDGADRAVHGSRDHVHRPRAARIGRGRDVSDGDACDVELDRGESPRLCARHHARLFEDRQCGYAADRDLADDRVELALARSSCLDVLSFIWAVVWGWYFRDNPRDHAKITPAGDRDPAGVRRQEGNARRAVGRADQAHGAGHLVYFCYGWTLWLFLTWIPQYFLHNYHMNLKNSARVRLGSVLRRSGWATRWAATSPIGC